MPGIEREELEKLRNDLAMYRALVAERQARIKAIEQEHAADYEAWGVAKSLLAATDQELRQRLCDFFYLTEDKQPVPGLVVKEVKSVVYDADRALDWVLLRLIRNVVGLYSTSKTDTEIVDALRNEVLFLALDGNAIKKAAESGMFGPSAPFKVERVAQANIASDLSKYL